MTGWPDPQPPQPEAPAPQRDTTAQGLAMLAFIALFVASWISRGPVVALTAAAVILGAAAAIVAIIRHTRKR